MGVTVFLGILVGIVVVAQTLYTSAVEHVQEFGTVSHRRLERDIYRILGEQALIAAVVGFVLGGLIRWRAAADGEALSHVLVSPGSRSPSSWDRGHVPGAPCSRSARGRIDPALVFRA